MDFERAVSIIIDLEGGYVNHPNDPGGETKYGISKRAYPHIYIPTLTKAEASEIYKRDYWARIQGDALPPKTRLVIFDAAVNQGPGFAVATAQAVVGAKPDGKVGPATIAALHACPPDLFLRKYMERRLGRYRALKEWNVFGLGWVKRLLDVLAYEATA